MYLLFCLHQLLVAALGFFIAACGLLSCSTWDLTRDGIRAPALGARSLTRRTTRDVPKGHLLSPTGQAFKCHQVNALYLAFY